MQGQSGVAGGLCSPAWVGGPTEEVDSILKKHKESSSPDYADSAPRVQAEGPVLFPLSYFFVFYCDLS